ncbi:MAG: histidine phosphatase family protein [Dehalococcoidia bacterium]
MTVTIDLVGHMDAGDRSAWQGDQDERPLSELGRRQAEAIADALGSEPVDALYAGPALRCRQTLEPIARQAGLSIVTLQEFGEETWRLPEGWRESSDQIVRSAVLGSHAAGQALAGIEKIRAERVEGRAVVCSHGHIIPALAAFFVGAHGLEGVGERSQRGQWYRVRIDGARVGVELRMTAQFPNP